MHSGSTRNREDDVDYLYPESGDESSVDDGSSDEEAAEGGVTEKVDTDKKGRQVIIYCGKAGGRNAVYPASGVTGEFRDSRAVRCHPLSEREDWHLASCPNHYGLEETPPRCTLKGGEVHPHPPMTRLTAIVTAFRWVVRRLMVNTMGNRTFDGYVDMAVEKLARYGLDLPFPATRLIAYHNGWMVSWVTKCRKVNDWSVMEFRNRFRGYQYQQFLRYAASAQEYWGGEHLMYCRTVLLGVNSCCRK